MKCHHCDKSKVYVKCRHCKDIYYCNSQCGHENWKTHKFECIGMKRGRDDEEQITLISQDGKTFQISVKEAKKSQTIMDFIEENGVDTPH